MPWEHRGDQRRHKTSTIPEEFKLLAFLAHFNFRTVISEAYLYQHNSDSDIHRSFIHTHSEPQSNARQVAITKFRTYVRTKSFFSNVREKSTRFHNKGVCQQT